jgi:hypothetical protein
VQIYASTSDSDVAATNEIDLGPYVNAGVQNLIGVWINYDLGAATDTDHTYDAKFQDSATTVDSDFADITNGGFTQVVDGSEGLSQIKFATMKRYVRAYLTMGGTAVSAYNFVGVIAVPRFDT